MKLPKSFYNWTSILGASLASIAFFLIIFFFVLSIVLDQGSSYLGLVIYIVLPVFMILGLFLIPIGMVLQIRRRNKQIFIENHMKWPRIDLNDQKHRNAFSIFILTSILFLFLSSIGSYEAFVYSESTQFCGTICHEVMEPEYSSYEKSAHARVACVDCHVGEGADWFVRSKLSGLYQVYSVLANKYPRPIPTPIKNLRPAQETCERCHWPEKFYSKRTRFQRNFLTDRNNTEWNITQLMKIGPDHHTQHLSEGIHWHINPDVKIEFMSADEKNEFILWIKYTNTKTGEEYIYQDQMMQPDSAFFADAKLHKMDCMDCHNRPTHIFQSPPDYIDEYLAAGKINQEIPHFKMAAMQALQDNYQTTDSANLHISEKIKSFYSKNYPALLNSYEAKIDSATRQVIQAFHENTFPKMKVRWDVYPNHLGHLESQGCFRCHDDNHATKDGRVISKDCNLCHSIIAQGNKDSIEFANPGQSLEFKHPIDIGSDWKDYSCADCHSYLYP